MLDSVDTPFNSTKTTDEEPTSATRRSALKGIGLSLAGLGEGANLLSLGSPTTMVELPKLKHGDEVLKWFKVPKEWNRHRNHASAVLEESRHALESKGGVVGTGLIASEESYQGVPGHQIRVFTESQHYPNPAIPSKIDGIPVIQRKAPVARAAGCSDPSGDCVNYDTSEYVAGGEQICWKYGGCGTTTCRVTNNDGTEFMLTAAHIFWDDCDDSQNIDDRTAARHDGTELGRVDYSIINEDWAVIDDSLGGKYRDFIDDNDDYPTVKGHVSEDQIAWWAGRTDDPCMSQMGCTTGETRGQIYSYKESYTNADCTDMGGEGVLTYADMGQGDSGGPTWHWENGDAYIVSCTGYYYYLHLNYSPCDNEAGEDSGGIAAYHIQDHGYTMGY